MLEFGRFRLDPEHRELLLDGEFLPVRPKLFDVLVYLVERRDRVVDKEELLDAVWPGVHVEESTLFQTVSVLRKELSRGGAGAHYVATVPGRGYRFVAEAAPILPAAARRPQLVEAIQEAGDRDGPTGEPTRPVGPNAAPRDSPRRRLLTLGLAAATVLALAAWSGWSHAPRLSPATLVEVPLTSYQGGERDPSFSLDGSQVAYARRASARDDWDIYVEVVGSGNAHVSVVASPADEFSPAISPDGSSIAFWRVDEQKTATIMVASALGGSERRLYVSEHPWRGPVNLGKLSWSPDGRNIAVGLRLEDDGPWRLALVPVQGGELSWLTFPPPDCRGDAAPAFAPDGRSIAFVRQQGDHAGQNIWLLAIPADGRPAGAPRQLTHFENRASAPAWMPSGREILFIGQQGQGAEGIWSVPAAGGEPTLVWRQQGVDQFPSLAVGRYTANGAVRIAYSWRQAQDTDIYRIALTGRERGKAEKLIATTRRDSLAQYSPDGRRIAYYSGWPERDIWVADADGSNPRRLTYHSDRLALPLRWSPGGDRIAYTSGFDPSGDLYVVDATGGDPERLTDDPRDEVRPTWSRDGNSIYFTRIQASGFWDLWKIPAAGGEAERLTRGGQTYAAATEGADGKSLRFVALMRDSALWELRLGDGLAAEPKRLRAFPEELQAAQFSDRGLYFATHRIQETGPLFFLDISTGEVEELFEIPGWLSSVHPDESSVLTVYGPQPGPDLNMLTLR